MSSHEYPEPCPNAHFPDPGDDQEFPVQSPGQPGFCPESPIIFDDGYGFGLAGPPKGVEPPCSYIHGGHHPVLLGDLLGHPGRERYQVIHKLGTGGFGNVWLCHVVESEPSEYVALKILMARASGEVSRELSNVHHLQALAKNDPDIEKYCLLPFDDFLIDGPNGSHQSFVYPAAGPPLREIYNVARNPHAYLRNLSRQAAEAMAVLHRHGICHGDFRPSNILLRLDGLNGMSVEEVFECLDVPEVTSVVIYEGANPNACVPEYIVNPIEFTRDINARLATDKICVIDFGESFDMSNPPSGLGIPLDYASPEVLLENQCGSSGDIYALATTMFELRLGSKLFSVDEDSIEDYLYCRIGDCGPLPEPWWSKWSDGWRQVHACFEPDNPVDESNWDEATVRRATIRKRTSLSIIHSIKRQMGRPVWHGRLPEGERVLFEDLLYRMTEHDAEKRPSIEEVLLHPWFSYGEEKTQVPVVDGRQLVEGGVTKPETVEARKVESVEVSTVGSSETHRPGSLEAGQQGLIDMVMSNSSEADKIGPVKEDNPQSSTDEQYQPDDIKMLQAAEREQLDAVYIEMQQALEEGPPPATDDKLQSTGIDMHYGVEVDDKQSVEAITSQSAEVNLHKSAEFNMSHPEQVSKAHLREVDKSRSKIEFKVVTYGVFAVSAWLRTTVGRAFNSVLG
ncbi:kinase-like domain-containing protein [Aspergillus aurantiobrunneus]